MSILKNRVIVETHDPADGMIRAMVAAGMRPLEPIASKLGSKKIRFRCEGDRKGRANGWAILHLDDRPAGAFGHYKLGIYQTWGSSDGRPLSRSERRDMALQYEAAARDREAKLDQLHREVAEACAAEFDVADDVNPTHCYLTAKDISGEGLRQTDGWLLVPMHDQMGAIWNLQKIGSGGRKLYAKDARTKGLFLLLGVPTGTICIAEGYGTAAVIRRATGHAVVVAFTWSNLKVTALTVQSLYPLAKIIICADDDAHLVENPLISRNIGVEAAEDAARAVGGRVALPPRNFT